MSELKILQLTITGYPDMVRSIYITNKKYTPEIEEKIQSGELARIIVEMNAGFKNLDNILPEEIIKCLRTDLRTDYEWYRKQIERALTISGLNLATKSTKNNGAIYPNQVQLCHSTISRFIDFSCTITGLHRGATDDFDAHAKRLDNRIIRMSTRTTAPDDLELSGFYQGKVLTLSEVADKLNLPDTIEIDGTTYQRHKFAYIDKDSIDSKDYDVIRGGTPLGISNTFTFKCNMTEWAHIVRLRNKDSHAAPELRQMIEMINSKLNALEPLLDDAFWAYCLQ